MPKFEVDVKAFINLKVHADTKAKARELADSIVNNDLSPDNETLARLSKEYGCEITTNGFDVDGTSEVEEAEEERAPATA